MASSRAVPNLRFRQLRGQRSPGEFAALVRRAAREIGEQVACDARYVGRVEAGEIRCPNYAYERVFGHMFPGLTLADLGFSAREAVRGRAARGRTPRATEPYSTTEGTGGTGGTGAQGAHGSGSTFSFCSTNSTNSAFSTFSTFRPNSTFSTYSDEESDVLRRAFITGGTATAAAASLGFGPLPGAEALLSGLPRQRIGTSEVSAVEAAVRQIRLLDDRHGADGLYRRAAQPLRAAFALLDAGATTRGSTAERLAAGAGELAISVGWLAHDSGRLQDARSHYAEALATARLAGDAALEAHAFCNTSFLARDAGRHREAVRAAQAGQRASGQLGSDRLLSLLSLREAGAWAGLGDRAGCERALSRAHTLFGRGPSDSDPEWMSFFGEPELQVLEAQCWSALGDWARAARHAQRAAVLQDPHFARNLALYRAQLAADLARADAPAEAAAMGERVLDALEGDVESTRIRAMLADTARVLGPRRSAAGVAAFLDRHMAAAAPLRV